MPLGFPVVPDVYRMKSRSSASIASGSHSGAAALEQAVPPVIAAFVHRGERSISSPARAGRRCTCWIEGHSARASSAKRLSGRTCRGDSRRRR